MEDFDYLGGFVSSPSAMKRLNEHLKKAAADYISTYALAHGEPEAAIRQDLEEYMADSWVTPLRYSKVNRTLESCLDAPSMEDVRELVVEDIIFTHRPIETVEDVEAHIDIKDTLSASETEALGLYVEYMEDQGIMPLDDQRFVKWLDDSVLPDKAKVLDVVKRQRIIAGIDEAPVIDEVHAKGEHLDVLIIPVGGEPYPKTLSPDANGSYTKALQACVGGNLEAMSWVFDDQPSIYCNDEGKFDCPPNRAIYVTAEEEAAGLISMETGEPVKQGELLDIACGDLVCVGFDPETDEDRSITPEEVSRVVARFGGEESILSGLREWERIKAEQERIHEEERRIQAFRDIETGSSAIDKGYDDDCFSL